jgi:hypothetical protein
MTVASIKNRHHEEGGQVVSREEKSREYVKRWRGFQFFLRFESREITRTLRSLPPRQTLALQTPEVLADLPAPVEMPLPGENPTPDTTKIKILMVASGVMPPDPGGPVG